MDFLATAEFWVAVSFVLFLAAIVYFGAHKKVAVALDARATAIAKELADAKALRDEAEAVLADYKKKSSNAAQEAQDIVDLAAKEAKALAEETSQKMTEQFERRMKLAKDKIAQAKTDALRDVRVAATDAAIEAAQSVIAKKLSADQANKLIEASIGDLKSKLN